MTDHDRYAYVLVGGEGCPSNAHRLTVAPPMSDLEGARDPNAPFVPQWCIERAKDKAEMHGGDPEKWLPFLEPTLRELRMLYGHPLPENDPERESRRRRAVENQRVLDAGRFADE